MDQKKMGQIGHAVILTGISLAWIAISMVVQRAFPNYEELDYILNKTRTVAVLTPILVWAGIYLNTVFEENLLDIKEDWPKAAVIVGVLYCVTTAWIYG
jgi:hypothetical protein